jgi:hypothetical protein
MATEDTSVFTTLKELKDLTVSYARQETLEPLKGVKRFLMFGVPGALLSALGLFLLSLAMLRALQTTTGDTFAGKMTWAPYLLTLLASAVVCGLFGRAITKKGDK